MDEQVINRESGGSIGRFIRSMLRARILAGVLGLVYLGGWALAGYGLSNRIEDHWPARVFWPVFAAWLSVMLVLPVVVVMLFFGGPENPAWLRGRFSLRTVLIALTLAAVGFGTIISLVG